MQHIVGALFFRQQAYLNAKKDATFTPLAWILLIVNVAVGPLLIQIMMGDSYYGQGSDTLVRNIIITAIFSVIWVAFSLWVGNQIVAHETKVTFGEFFRTVSLAYVWSIVVTVLLFLVVRTQPYLIARNATLVILIGLVPVLALGFAIRQALTCNWMQAFATMVMPAVLIIAVVGCLLSVFATSVLDNIINTMNSYGY